MALILGDVTEETHLRRATESRSRLGGLIGRDRRMRELYDLVEHEGEMSVGTPESQERDPEEGPDELAIARGSFDRVVQDLKPCPIRGLEEQGVL